MKSQKKMRESFQDDKSSLVADHLICKNWTFSFLLKTPSVLLPDIRTNTRTSSVTEIVIKAALAQKKVCFASKNLPWKNVLIFVHWHSHKCALYFHSTKNFPIFADAIKHLSLFFFAASTEELRIFNNVQISSVCVTSSGGPWWK